MTTTNAVQRNYDYIPENDNEIIDQVIDISKKIYYIGRAILPYMPIFGTVIGIYHACTIKGPTDDWDKAEIIAEIFSFLIFPQVIYLVAKHYYFEDDFYKELKATDDKPGLNEEDYLL